MSYLFKRIHDLLRKGQSDQFEDLLTELFAEVLEDEDKLQGFAGTFFGIKAKQIQDIVIVYDFGDHWQHQIPNCNNKLNTRRTFMQ